MGGPFPRRAVRSCTESLSAVQRDAAKLEPPFTAAFLCAPLAGEASVPQITAQPFVRDFSHKCSLLVFYIPSYAFSFSEAPRRSASGGFKMPSYKYIFIFSCLRQSSQFVFFFPVPLARQPLGCPGAALLRGHPHVSISWTRTLRRSFAK